MQTFLDWLKVQEMGTGPYIGPCIDTDNYQVFGACSDQNSEKKNAEIRSGKTKHKKIRK